MYKLLTDEGKQKVEREYAARRLVVILSALVLVLVVALIGLLPLHLVTNTRQDEVIERTRILGSAGQRGDEAELQTWLKETNRKLEILSPKLDTDRPLDFVQEILDQKNAGIFLNGFSWTKEGDKISLLVSGMADTRQTLAIFEGRIRASGQFTDVTLPISNLAQDRDIDFQVKLSPIATP